MIAVPLHIGALHPLEQALVLLAAFGPFVVLAIVATIRSRRDASPDDTPGHDESST